MPFSDSDVVELFRIGSEIEQLKKKLDYAVKHKQAVKTLEYQIRRLEDERNAIQRRALGQYTDDYKPNKTVHRHDKIVQAIEDGQTDDEIKRIDRDIDNNLIACYRKFYKRRDDNEK